MLRHVDQTSASIWVETSEAARVIVRAEARSESTPWVRLPDLPWSVLVRQDPKARRSRLSSARVGMTGGGKGESGSGQAWRPLTSRL